MCIALGHFLQVKLEIRDTTDNCLLYEVQVPFEQLLGEPQLL